MASVTGVRTGDGEPDRVGASLTSAHIRVDPLVTAATAGDLLDLAQWLDEHSRPTLGEVVVARRFLGDTDAGDTLAAACAEATAEVRDVLSLCGEALIGHADRLYQTAFAYQRADESFGGRVRPGQDG